MKGGPAAAAALIGIGLALSACANEEYRWVQEGASENRLRSDIFWCTRVEREQYHRHNDPRPGGSRRSFNYVDASCMRERGWRREPVE